MLSDAAPETDAGLVEQAARCLTEHVTSPAKSRYGERDPGEPTRLTFLLDHEYSQKGLGAQRFKGADAERVRVLQAAAEQAGCETVLALAEIKETWDAIPAGGPWAGGGYDDEFEDYGVTRTWWPTRSTHDQRGPWVEAVLAQVVRPSPSWAVALARRHGASPGRGRGRLGGDAGEPGGWTGLGPVGVVVLDQSVPQTPASVLPVTDR